MTVADGRNGRWRLRTHSLSRTAGVRSAVLALLMLQGCVYLPRTTEVYDPGCRITSKHMELEPVQVAALGGCTNSNCAALLAAVGAVAAASAVISGSIVVVGNVAYWFEKQGRCVRER